SDKLMDDDEKDTSAQTRSSHRKVYKLKLSEGQVVRIDLTSKDFDTFLRLEDGTGKELAFNDDVAHNNLNSRLNFPVPKTGEYRIIATTFEAGKTGAFNVEVKSLTGAEAAEARLQARVDAFGSSSPAEQKQIIAEFTKALQAKGSDKLTIPDAQR